MTSRRAGERGLTLIELMVALAVFAVLGLLSYRALSQMSDHQGRIASELERWRGIGRSMLRIESDLLQIVSPAARPDSSPLPSLQLIRLPGLDNELRLLVNDGTRRRVTRVGFRFSEGRLSWVRWPGRLPEGTPTLDPLLEDVRAVRWRFLLNGQRVAAWPPDNARADLLPQAIELELELPDAGTLTRLVALR